MMIESYPVVNHPYLGVMLSIDRKWNSHVNNIVAKANRSLSFVRRNLYPCTETTKRSAYVTIASPTLQYAIHTDKSRLMRLKQSSLVQQDL